MVEVAFGGGTLKFEVLEVKDTVRKEDAGEMYRIINE